MSSRARVVLGGVGAGLAALALIGDLVFLVVHDEQLHLDIHVVLGVAVLLAGFAALGLSLALLLQGLGERRRAHDAAAREQAERDRSEAEPVEQEERIDRA